jgi:DNA repair exonuclease SbcCD ATPase subunit
MLPFFLERNEMFTKKEKVEIFIRERIDDVKMFFFWLYIIFVCPVIQFTRAVPYFFKRTFNKKDFEQYLKKFEIEALRERLNNHVETLKYLEKDLNKDKDILEEEEKLRQEVEKLKKELNDLCQS